MTDKEIPHTIITILCSIQFSILATTAIVAINRHQYPSAALLSAAAIIIPTHLHHLATKDQNQ